MHVEILTVMLVVLYVYLCDPKMRLQRRCRYNRRQRRSRSLKRSTSAQKCGIAAITGGTAAVGSNPPFASKMLAAAPFSFP